MCCLKRGITRPIYYTFAFRDAGGSQLCHCASDPQPPPPLLTSACVLLIRATLYLATSVDLAGDVFLFCCAAAPQEAKKKKVEGKATHTALCPETVWPIRTRSRALSDKLLHFIHISSHTPHEKETGRVRETI